MYSVYVIEISDERGRRLNPKYPNVYVGQTALTPEARFAQHRAGYKASRHLWKGGKGRGQWLGRWLKRRLYGRYNPIETRAEAERLEAWLAEHLRRKGLHGVCRVTLAPAPLTTGENQAEKASRDRNAV